MKPGPLGIFYLDYSNVVFPRSQRKLIIGYTRSDFLEKLALKNVPDDYFCWLRECRTPKFLVDGNVSEVRAWIDKHMPEKFGDPLVGV